MRRRRLLVPLLLALSGLGWAAAHALAHRAVTADTMSGTAGVRAYLHYLPTSLALCLALALPLAAGAAVGHRWRARSGRSLWLFGVVPVLGYVGHALVEPLARGSSTLAGLPAGAGRLAPVLLVGLLLQIPLALAVIAAARGILRVAEGVALALLGPRRPTGCRARDRRTGGRPLRLPGFRLDLGRSQRAPPSALLV